MYKMRSYTGSLVKMFIWSSHMASLIWLVPLMCTSFTSSYMALNKPLELGFNVYLLILEDLGFVGSNADTLLFNYHSEGVSLIMLIYV